MANTRLAAPERDLDARTEFRIARILPRFSLVPPSTSLFRKIRCSRSRGIYVASLAPAGDVARDVAHRKILPVISAHSVTSCARSSHDDSDSEDIYLRGSSLLPPHDVNSASAFPSTTENFSRRLGRILHERPHSSRSVRLLIATSCYFLECIPNNDEEFSPSTGSSVSSRLFFARTAKISYIRASQPRSVVPIVRAFRSCIDSLRLIYFISKRSYLHS